MIKVNIREQFETSLGLTFIADNNLLLKIGDEIEVNGKSYTIKRLLTPTVPLEDEIISIIV